MHSLNQLLLEFSGRYCGPCEFARVMCAYGGDYPDETKLADETIHHLCQAAFAASMKTEEGGYCRTRFVRPQHSVMHLAAASMIRFGSPVPIRGASDVTKTAIIATGPMALMLDQNGFVPTVTGVVDYRWLTSGAIGGPWVDYEPLPGLHLEVLKPGMLKCGPFLLSDGRIERLWDKKESFGEFPKAHWRWGEFAAAHPARPSPFCSHQVGADLVRTVWVRMWPVLLGAIRMRGHGGTLVLVPDGHRGTWGGRTILNFNFGALIRRLAEAIYDKYLVPPAEQAGMQLTWEIARRDLLTAVGTLADLTQMDGAVLLTHSLDVVAAGLRLVPQGPRLAYSQDDPNQSPTDPEDFAKGHGTRHNSAMDYCATSPDTTAIVISQDGGLSLVASSERHWTLFIPRLG